MADSRRALFVAAAGGNISPILVKWWAQEGISLPGETWPALYGWLATTLIFAAFAGWVVTDVWKEKTSRRAFLVGLALPYILWGALADIAASAKVPRARAQSSAEAPTPAAPPQGVTGRPVAVYSRKAGAWLPIVTLKVEVVDTTSGAAVQDARISVQSPETDFAVSGSKLQTYALPIGDYHVIASAPGYSAARAEVTLTEEQTLPLKLQPLSWWGQFLSGVQSVVLPPARLPQTLPFEVK